MDKSHAESNVLSDGDSSRNTLQNVFQNRVRIYPHNPHGVRRGGSVLTIDNDNTRDLEKSGLAYFFLVQCIHTKSTTMI